MAKTHVHGRTACVPCGCKRAPLLAASPGGVFSRPAGCVSHEVVLRLQDHVAVDDARVIKEGQELRFILKQLLLQRRRSSCGAHRSRCGAQKPSTVAIV